MIIKYKTLRVEKLKELKSQHLKISRLNILKDVHVV